MMIIERKRKRNESVSQGLLSVYIRGKGRVGGESTEDEFLRGREHVEGKGDFVLVAFALEPAEEGGCVEHGLSGEC